ncbi:probable ATP-dependent RNA helicase DDX49 [Halichondria panicea]|uniref:probable ATP-dependent RNA helicase DDX49 n=1 Tax=Halichondria panicea TaxID=6063 RepID=UPI00312B381B
MGTTSFPSLGLSDWLVGQVNAVGIKDPTPVQVNCIPPILEGRDCIGCSKTGSGKTAAFALPILHRLSEDPYGVFALVLTPTRELAYQIAEQFRVFGSHIGLKDVVVVGGIDMMKQGLSLAKKPHIVIATPGRLADHLANTDTVSLKRIKFLVLDEADRLLDPSFEEALEVIFDHLPKKRQTLLFSATLTDTIGRLREVATNEPFCWEAPREEATVEELDQKYVLMPAKVKDCYLIYLMEHLHNEEKKTLILFTPTCRSCQVYSILLRNLDYPCVALHSILSQSQRLASLNKFKSGHVRILVATDVASRGLDIPTVDVVVNVNIPASSKDYIHRVGRTARAGRGGLALSLVTQYDIDRLKSIEENIKTTLTEYDSKESEVLKLLNSVNVAKREVEIRLGDTDFGERRKINKRKRKLLEGYVKARKTKKKT